jgi:tRNA threonylcarbamoyl adenosine modification protein YeaZ
LNVLAICATGTSGSIAVCRDNVITFSSFLDICISQSERLMPAIDIGLKQSGIGVKDIDLIALANGPGSFTGVRIGLATAKGLSFSNEIPIYPVNTLELLAYNAYGIQRAILPFIDAKMDEVYAALYSPFCQNIIAPQNCSPSDFLKLVKQPVLILGDGVFKFMEQITASGADFEIGLNHQHIPQAIVLISMALKLKLIPKYNFDLISNLEPYYLRKSQAELVKEHKENQ